MLTVERLRELLHYDRETGRFTWLVSRGCVRAGSAAGTLRKDGYLAIKIDGAVPYLAHRLAWFYVKGEWPEGNLDHKNLIRDHNWLDNLRPATDTQNQANSRVRSDNKLGVKGVCLRKGRKSRPYEAHITVGRRYLSLGYYASSGEASVAYLDAARLHFGEFARGS